MSNYAKADTRTQWFADNFPGSHIEANCGVLHTTEGMSWDPYQGGATAPTYTAKPDIPSKRLIWRAHFPDEMSARALRNEAGGVNTNTANAIQVELVGTCDEAHRNTWGGKRAGVDYIFWPNAPEWALRNLAEFIADMNKRHGIKIQGPAMWLAYGADERAPGRRPASYGASPARMSFAQWRAFYGWCGHQHVPENDHGDPGRLDWATVERMAKAIVTPEPPPPPKPPIKKLGIHLCLAGDWNEGPKSTGKHSPSWIAEQGGLAIYPPPPNGKGQYGIDYPMSSAPCGDVHRLAEDISDHNPVIFTVVNPQDGRKLKGVTFNVERDRGKVARDLLVAWLAETGQREGVDFFALQEVRQYHDELAAVKGYTLYAATEPAGVEHNALLVRNGVEVEDVKYRLTSKVGWFTVTGGTHDPSSAVLATLNGWLRVASVHEAPTVNWVSGKPVGPARRVAVRMSSARTLARIGRYWKARR